MDKEIFVEGFMDELEKIGLRGTTIVRALMRSHAQSIGKVPRISRLPFFRRIIALKGVPSGTRDHVHALMMLQDMRRVRRHGGAKLLRKLDKEFRSKGILSKFF